MVMVLLNPEKTPLFSLQCGSDIEIQFNSQCSVYLCMSMIGLSLEDDITGVE